MSENNEEPRPMVPSYLRRPEVVEALKPLCDLLGITALDFFDSPGITVGDHAVSFTLATRPHGKANSPDVPLAVIGEVVVVGSHPATESGITVTVPVR